MDTACTEVRPCYTEKPPNAWQCVRVAAIHDVRMQASKKRDEDCIRRVQSRACLAATTMHGRRDILYVHGAVHM